MRNPQTATTPRTQGGKAALRLLQLLESAGLTRHATELVARAGGTEPAEFLAAAQRASAAPSAALAAARVGETSAVTDLSAEYLAAGQRLSATAFATGLPPWVSLGPTNVPNGQTYGASTVSVAGRVSALAIDPAAPNHVLAGAANGGVWESFDRGVTWAPRTDNAATTTVGAIAFDPSDPSTVYCGTGEGDWWSFLGAGVLKSTDGGTTWSPLCTDPFVGDGFFALVVDPTDSRRLLGATVGGLFLSTDGGTTWQGRRPNTTWAISVASGSGPTREILAACTDGLYSSNAGVNWTHVTLPGAPPFFDRLSVAIAPSDPTVAYAWGSANKTPWLWRRSGGTWTKIATPPDVDTGQAWYDWFVAVAPDNASQVYVGAIDTHRGDRTGGAWQWTNLSSKGVGEDSIHPDQHAIAVHPAQPDTVYIGCDGGVYRSDNRGVNWTACNNGLVIAEFEYLAHNAKAPSYLLGGTQDNGTLRWTGSKVWRQVAEGDGGDCGVNQTTPTTVISSYINMTLYRSTTSGDPNSWQDITPPVAPNEATPFYPPFECSTRGNTIAIGGARLYVSRDVGSTWKPIVYPNGGMSTALYVPDPDTVYVGLDDGRIFVVRWSGNAWGALTALTTPRDFAFISDLYVDAAHPNWIWATSRTVGGGRVFFSTDAGKHWSDRSAGLPELPINAVIGDPGDSNRLWVGADLGVYETLDQGASWHAYNRGLPNAYVGDLLFHPGLRRLRAGTRSRGVWEVSVDGAVPLQAAVTVESVAFPGVYLRLNGTGIVQQYGTGAGNVDCAFGPGPWKKFRLEQQLDGAFAVASVAFPGVYLRCDGTGLSATNPASGVVNCQVGVGATEKFRLEQQPDGTVALASVAYPGVYVRANGTGITSAASGAGAVNCHFGMGPWKKFWLEQQPDGTVAFTSAAFPGVRLRVNGTGVVRQYGSGAGGVDCAFGKGPWKQFRVQAQLDGSVALASVAFPGAYLRVDGTGITATHAGIGTVNGQVGVGPWEKFQLERQPDGSVAFSSLAFPGVYLRLDGTGVTSAQSGAGKVDAHYGMGPWKKFRLVVAD